MDAAALISALQEAVPGVQVESAPSVDLQPTLYIPREQLVAVARALRDRTDLRFEVLAELTAVDWWPREPRFEVVYILISVEHGMRLRLQVRLNGEDAHLRTVCEVWPSANWFEREVWDMFGIVFDGHPDLRRLLMPEDWDGYPLRKDYPVQINMPAKVAEPLQVTEQEFRANVEKDRRARG